MSGNYFRKWMAKKENKSFWLEPMASEKFDRMLADTRFQKSIAATKSNQFSYSFIEHKIVSDYALLINCKLREQFKALTEDEFEDPKGFECKDKSSFRQQNYFELRHHIEYFLKNDIKQHANRDAELNAFRRWVEISDLLLRQHCYEGFLLVIVNLQLLSRADLINGLPVTLQENYQKLCDLSAPSGNHKALRDLMQKNRNYKDFDPLLFSYHAITVLNESISQLEEHKSSLTNKKNILAKQQSIIHSSNPRIVNKIIDCLNNEKKIPRRLTRKYGLLIKPLVELFEERKLIDQQLQNIPSQLNNRIEQRNKILGMVTKQQEAPLRQLPVHLEQTYRLIISRYNKRSIEREKRILPPEPPTSRITDISSLYSKNLMPSFWATKRKSNDKYWDQIFTPSYLSRQ